MRVESLLCQEKEMEVGHFYYIEDSYFVDFPDPYLMKNKETINGQVYDRLVFIHFKTLLREYIG